MSHPAPVAYDFGPFRLEPAERRLLLNGKAVALSPRALNALAILVKNHGHLVENTELNRLLWGDTIVEVTSLNVCIHKVRKTLREGSDSIYIETIPRSGFRFVHPVKEVKTDDGLRMTASSVISLPYDRNPFFVGRQDVLLLLHFGFRTGKKRQAVCGMSGIGKTQVAVEYIHLHREEYKHILWVRSDTGEARDSSFVKIAQQLSLTERESQAEIDRSVMSWPEAHSDWLMVFDSVDELSLLQPCLSRCFSGDMLVTSQSLDLQEIHILEPIRLGAFTNAEALDFLKRRAPRAFESPSASADEVAKTIANNFRNLPLALEQTAAYIEHNSCELTDFLDNWPLLLERHGAVFGVPGALFEVSAGLNLDKVKRNSEAKELLEISSFLAPDSIPLDILQGIVFSTVAIDDHSPLSLNPQIQRERLAFLRGLSLVSWEGGDDAYSIHPLIQNLVQRRLIREEAKRCSATTVALLLRMLPPPTYSAWPDWERWLPHILSALRSTERYDVETSDVIRLLNRVATYLTERGRFECVNSLLRRAAALCDRVHGTRSQWLALTLSNLGFLSVQREQFHEAEEFYRAQLCILEANPPSDDVEISRVLSNIGTCLYWQNKFGEAERLYERAKIMRIRRLGEEHEQTATILLCYTNVLRDTGRLQEAEPLYRRILSIYERTIGCNHPDFASVATPKPAICGHLKTGHSTDVRDKGFLLFSSH